MKKQNFTIKIVGINLVSYPKFRIKIAGIEVIPDQKKTKIDYIKKGVKQ